MNAGVRLGATPEQLDMAIRAIVPDNDCVKGYENTAGVETRGHRARRTSLVGAIAK